MFDLFIALTQGVRKEDYITNGVINEFKFFDDYVKMYGYSGELFCKGGIRNQAKRIHDLCDRYFLNFYEESFVKQAVAGEDVRTCLIRNQFEAGKYVRYDKVEMAEKTWMMRCGCAINF